MYALRQCTAAIDCKQRMMINGFYPVVQNHKRAYRKARKMRKGRKEPVLVTTLVKFLITAIVVAASFISNGCGGEEAKTKAEGQPAPGYSADIMKQLEYDARVDSSTPPQQDGNKLIVTVNEDWVKDANYGSREWTLKGWYAKWQAARGGGSAPAGLQVVVRYNGQDVDRYSANGYEPLEKKKAN